MYAGKCNFFFICKLPFYVAVFEVVFFKVIVSLMLNDFVNSVV